MEGRPGANPVDEVAQRRDRMQLTIDGLRRAVELADRGDGGWQDAVAQAMNEAAATWERHVAGTEAPRGILAEVLEREPRLAHMVDALRADHVELRAVLGRAREKVTTQDPAHASEEVQAVAARLSRHHHLGAELIHSAYDVELGGGG